VSKSFHEIAQSIAFTPGETTHFSSDVKPPSGE